MIGNSTDKFQPISESPSNDVLFESRALCKEAKHWSIQVMLDDSQLLYLQI